jgi:hypothetical protein
VNTAQTHMILGGVPLLVAAVLFAWTMSKKSPHPASYKLSEPWTYGPILWAATGEKIGAGGHGHDDHFSVGGGASGKW